jgi:hypothetical protein
MRHSKDGKIRLDTATYTTYIQKQPGGGYRVGPELGDPVTPPEWWAQGLPDPATCPVSSIPEDGHILAVLGSRHGEAMTYRQIVTESTRLEREDRGNVRRLSYNMVRSRVPILITLGLVERPPGTQKKGVAITAAGRRHLDLVRPNSTQTRRKN